MAADTLVLKDQAISIQTADWKFIIFDQFQTKWYMYSEWYNKMKL